MTVLVLGVFARGFFVGPGDWLVGLGGALLFLLCLFGHFSWLLWMIGFVGWRTRPSEAIPPNEPITTRTALVMPIYHEEVGRVAAGIRATWLSARRAELESHCDFFVLSDSADWEIRVAEEHAVEALLPLFSKNPKPSGRLFLVRREDRANYKAGNIASFLGRHGGAYDFMVVLDADSVMLGERIRRLILKLQRRPRTAILQSLMSTFRGATPFAQAMQFSITRLGQIFSSGFSWFLGPEALYWGHNAIIRIAPFMAHAQLPVYPGKPPFGGRVLSQDVHEATLLGRAGWDVELDLEPGGSFEEIPSNVISYGRRDQRWCTGDFLNSALILARGCRTGQRVWLGYAMGSYSISVVLLAMMLVGFGLAARVGASTIDPVAIWWALIYMPVIQLGSKCLLFWLHLDRRMSIWRQMVSLGCDIGAGLLLTPLLVYQHLTFVVGLLIGKGVQWTSPSRDPNNGVGWRLATRVFWIPTLISAVWIALAWVLAPAFLFFSSLILVPWLMSIPLAVASSDRRLGAWLAGTGVFACRRGEGELLELDGLVSGTSDQWWLEHGSRTPPGAGRPDSRMHAGKPIAHSL
jgi:membrane glycosyltransferase